jgi:hypothetical protein
MKSHHQPNQRLKARKALIVVSPDLPKVVDRRKTSALA